MQCFEMLDSRKTGFISAAEADEFGGEPGSAWTAHMNHWLLTKLPTT